MAMHYDVRPLREVLGGVAALLDNLFPGSRDTLRVGILEGGSSDHKPWFLTVEPDGTLRDRFDPDTVLELRISPEGVLDAIASGAFTVDSYAAGMFARLVQELGLRARDADWFMAHTKERLAVGQGGNA